jgi:hypothetical protein
MKRRVLITLDVDPAEYHASKDTPRGAVALVVAMLQDRADLPETYTVSCENASRTVKGDE